MKQRDSAVILSEHGYKLTPQRLAILDVITRSREHLTPAVIYKKVCRTHPGMGLTTVYRTLDVMTELGLVDRVHLGDTCRSYSAQERGHRHNIVCTRCGLVVDFIGCDLEDLSERLSCETGFKIEGHLLQFQGLCRNCQKT